MLGGWIACFLSTSESLSVSEVIHTVMVTAHAHLAKTYRR